MMTLSIFLEDKIKEAIQFIRKHEPEEGYIVKFSGGKDSIVLYDLVKKAGVKYRAFYNFTSIDPPEVVRFIKKYYPEVKFIKPSKVFWQWLPFAGPPTKARRWCSTKLKFLAPFERGKKLLVGVRADESPRRAQRGRIYYNREGKNYVYAPIFYFTENEIWQYINKYDLPYPEPYDEGFTRVACVICPFLCGNSELLRKHREKWPQYYLKFELLVEEYFERRKDFFHRIGVKTASAFLEKWYKGEAVGYPEDEAQKKNGKLFV